MTSVERDVALLNDLRSISGPGSTVIDAGLFQNVLEKHGIPLGSELGDSIVLQCKVNTNGEIDFSGFQTAVGHEKSGIVGVSGFGASPEKVARPVIRPPAPSAGAPLHVDIHSPRYIAPEGLGPKDRVRAYTGDIRDLFNQYDTGRIDIHKLHDGIRKLGLEETSAFQHLIRAAPLDLTFSQLFQSLLQINETPTSSSGFVPEYHTSRQPRDVISWRSNEPDRVVQVQAQAGIARLPVSPQAAESVDSPWNTLDTNAANKQVYVATSPKKSQDSRRKITEHRTNVSSVKLASTVPEPPPSSIEVLKEQIYSCVRMLDQGRITAHDFEKRMRFLNITVPPGVERLLVRFKADGNVKFQQFVLAFEPLFRDFSESVQPNLASVNPPAAPGLPRDHIHENRRHIPATDKGGVTSMAQETHGDLIAWSEGPSQLEKLEISSKDTGRKHSGVTASNQDHVDLTWRTETNRTAPESYATNNIIAWDSSNMSATSAPNGKGRMPVRPNVNYPFDVETE